MASQSERTSDVFNQPLKVEVDVREEAIQHLRETVSTCELFVDLVRVITQGQVL